MLRTLFTALIFLSTTTFREKRMLLIFADKPGNQLVKKQKDILDANAAGIKERDIEVLTYYEGKDRVQFQKRSVKDTFTVILIGKDGGEKYRATQPITLSKLFGFIDAMPMRVQEMKSRP
ncbi:DUF4174 domain-containing protein [Mucilaginibacter sp. PAMB04168]|uniref:DUF4174 domain-containing protein n=1 Tax=Mucilaginibacter sp. PAMB04168 TaxID=3138567 RepID=UPI0031F6BE7F